MNEIKVPISPGELLDKITILRIKSQRMSTRELSNVRLELRALEETWGASAYAKHRHRSDIGALLAVNERLWVIEDDIATRSVRKPSMRNSSDWRAPSTSKTTSAPPSSGASIPRSARASSRRSPIATTRVVRRFAPY